VGEKLARKALSKEVQEIAKKCSTCPHCGAFNGTIKKVGALKLLHEKYVNVVKPHKRPPNRWCHSSALTAFKPDTIIHSFRLQSPSHCLRQYIYHPFICILPAGIAFLNKTAFPIFSGIILA